MDDIEGTGESAGKEVRGAQPQLTATSVARHDVRNIIDVGRVSGWASRFQDGKAQVVVQASIAQKNGFPTLLAVATEFEDSLDRRQ